MTLVLTRSDLESVLDVEDCLGALRAGFRAPTGAVVGQRVRTDLPFPGTATALIPGLLPGIEAYTVKVNAKFPGARPALRGVICLHAGADGELLALLDSATVTAWRTGLAAALGTDLLACPGDSAGVIGAGAQAELMLRGLRALGRPYPDLVVHDTDDERAAAFAARHGGRAVGSATEAAATADTLLLATWSRQPLLKLADTRAGQHFTSLGADEPGKQELAADLLDNALLVVDDRELAAGMGALAAAGLPATAADATLGEVLRGEHPGRASEETRSVYAPVGLPWQDLALAWVAYERAVRDGVGRRVDLLA
ncbi:ornithine cyclodeaminase family protein [Streptomyces pseudovenezuelae]|uniref:Ornithine cyclodeaminase/alanine dehydrogenase-like protein (Mu-crystallin family) n=1 Tax=Streptomyces pseudovenezuelae TaxID=67350 RepID=A0ABT6L9J3_9ACTN|nr:NAD(P)-binding domain-containing protein [Streptomyces pseudovenezuelae]MDH6212985.1 ornithine cyclodeaminase/alanine dehydrogenase-like protein (mu-crystallin family) [Streptomyces pseudovenezuelae]